MGRHLQLPSAADARTAISLARAALDPLRPLLVNLTVTRRCNLSCGYCTEYDDHSPLVPLAALEARLDQLRRMRAVLVVLTGGESLLHPRLAEVVAAVRARGMTPTVNTNGFLLTEKWIDALNAAGLSAMQLSVDAVKPNAVTQKALKTLGPKLELLSTRAKFRVRVNTVLGAADPEEALEVARTVHALGLEAKVSLLREKDGTLAKLSPRAEEIFAELQRMQGRGGKLASTLFSESFQEAMLRDGEMNWKCRAGARFFHVDEFGRVDLCAPQAGSPGKPLEEYGREDLRRAFESPKPCAARCPVAYAHQVSAVDALRPQRGEAWKPGRGARLPVIG